MKSDEIETFSFENIFSSANIDGIGKEFQSLTPTNRTHIWEDLSLKWIG